MADGTLQGSASAATYRAQLKLGWRRRLPMILQTEAAECGLACLAMVSVYHGHDVDLPSLRRRFSTSLKGATLARLMVMATQLGFSSRPLRLELEELKQLKCPCILHWDLNHFVVLKRVTTHGIEIHDPGHGVHKARFNEVSNHFTGVVLELTPATDFKPVKERQHVSLRALTGAFRGIVPALAQIFVLALVLEVFALVAPFYMQWVLDQVLVSADRDLLTLLSIGFVIVTVFQVSIGAARSWAVTWLSTTIATQWQSGLVHHLLRLPFAWYEKRHIGDVVSRLGSAQTIQKTVTTQLIGTLLDGLMSAATLAVMFFYSVPLSLLTLAIFLAYGLLRWLFFGPLFRATEDQIVQSAQQQSELLEINTRNTSYQACKLARHAGCKVHELLRADHQSSYSCRTTKNIIYGLEQPFIRRGERIARLDGSELLFRRGPVGWNVYCLFVICSAISWRVNSSVERLGGFPHAYTPSKSLSRRSADRAGKGWVWRFCKATGGQ